MAIAPASVGLVYALLMRSVSPRALTFRETIGVYYTAVFELAASGLFAFLIYGAAAALATVAGWAHIEPRWARDLAWWSMVVIGTFCLFGNTGMAADLLSPKLFPKTGIGNPPLFPGITGRRLLGPCLWTLVGIVAMVVGILFHLRLAFIVVDFCMTIAGFTFHSVLESTRPNQRAQTASAAVQKLLDAGGYTVIDRLQTGMTDLDRLLTVFDIVAVREGYALAIQLLVGEEGAAPVSWTEAASVKSATSAVYAAAGVYREPVRRVRPMIVLCGRTPDRSLKAFTMKEGILMAELPEWKVIEDIAAGRITGENLQALAQSHLGLRAPASQEPA